jgi:lysophospholipid acyltransferase (LPLAT)-like uncharacterized protein
MAKLGKCLFNKSAASLLRFFRWSIRFEVHNQPIHEPVVYAFWHRNLMLCCLQRAGDHIAVIISASKDGELIAGPMKELGYIPIRGSSSRQGSQALKAMLRLAKEVSLGITPDGPRGPVGTIHPGVFQLALLGKIPIVGVACDANREWVFNSWDRFRFPKPFAKVTVHYSEPIPVLCKDDIASAEAKLRDFLQ